MAPIPFTELFLLLLVFSIALLTLFLINRNNKYLDRKKSVFYSLGFTVLYALLGFTGSIKSINEKAIWFLVLQLTNLAIGGLFCWLLYKGVWGELKRKALSETLLIVVTASLGASGFIFIFGYYNDSDLAASYSACFIPVIIPYLLHKTFISLASIPPEIYKVWHYPLNTEDPDIDSIDTRKVYLMEIEFSKAPSESAITNFKAKAPIEMPFGEWYRHFIKSYNTKFEESQIHYKTEEGFSHQWIFYTQPSFWKPKKYIDPDLTIHQNQLNEKHIIVAKRVKVHVEEINYN